MSLGPVRLGLPDGRLALRSEPSGASVSVGGVYRGQTPVDIGVAARYCAQRRAHRVPATKLRRVKFLDARARTARVSVPLSGVFGEVTVAAQPADAQLFIDGQAADAANQKLRLVATTHDIEIRKAGFVTYKTSITPRPGVPQKIETALLTPEQTQDGRDAREHSQPRPSNSSS